MKEVKKFLKKVPIFSKLADEDLRKVSAIVVQKAYKKGELLFAEGSRGDTLFVLVKGKVKLFKEAKIGGRITGETKIFEIISEGEFLGEMSLLNQVPRCASAAALEDCWIYQIQKKNFNDILMKKPEIALSILGVVSQRLRQADTHIQDITFRNIPGRLANFLLKLADKFGKPTKQGPMINVRLTQQELAQAVGTSRVYTSKYISAFKKEGSIAVSKGKIIILDRDKLGAWM